jgi:hypothetical protein
VGFRARGELRTLDAAVGRPVDHVVVTGGLRRGDEMLAQPPAERVGHGHMGHQSTTEEGGGAQALGAVDDLIRHDQGAGGVAFGETAHRADREDVADAELAQGVEVRPGGHLARAEPVPLAVPGQESQPGAAQHAESDAVARAPVRGVHSDDFNVFEHVQVVQSAAADDTDPRPDLSRVDHAWPPIAGRKLTPRAVRPG